MSLINEALKKAQRQRNEEPADLTAPAASGGRIAKHGRARSAQSMILLASGAVVLVVASVVLTIFLLNRPGEKPAPSIAAATVPPPKTEEKRVTPIVLAPTIKPPVTQTEPATAPTLVTTTPAPTLTVPAPTVPTPAPVAVEPKPSVPAASPAPPAIDERVQAYVEALRITGVKAAGAESRVLMNDQFYRINQVVDRTLGLKLIKVDSTTLTFADANGMTYVKYY